MALEYDSLPGCKPNIEMASSTLFSLTGTFRNWKACGINPAGGGSICKGLEFRRLYNRPGSPAGSFDYPMFAVFPQDTNASGQVSLHQKCILDFGFRRNDGPQFALTERPCRAFQLSADARIHGNPEIATFPHRTAVGSRFDPSTSSGFSMNGLRATGNDRMTLVLSTWSLNY